MKPPLWLLSGAVVGLALGLALLLRSCFPVTVPGIPRIVTQYDTVPKLVPGQIRWRDKLVADARVERERDSLRTLLERLTTTLPETVYLAPRESGMGAIHVGKRVGDSTLVGGFTLEPLDSGYTRREWIAQFYTAGPLRSLVVDSGRPRITFYPPPPKPCGTWCKLGYVGIGGSLGAGATALACAVVH